MTLLRVIDLVACALMLVFTAVQYNDPDGLEWALVYLVPAFWCWAVAQRPAWFAGPGTRGLAMRLALFASVPIWAALMVMYWPPMADFWVSEVWMNEETAREGMGAMLAFAAVVLAAGTALGRKPQQSAAA